MARGSLMCGNFMSIYVPWAIFFTSLGCIVIGGSCLGVGINMFCWDGIDYDSIDYECYRISDNLVITGITFLVLAGFLKIIAIVLFSIIYCCPQISQHPQRSYISSAQPVYAIGQHVGYPGSMALSGVAINQQVYQLVPIQMQQQNGAQAYFSGYQTPQNLFPGIVPATGNPAATVSPIATSPPTATATMDSKTVPHF